MSRLTAQHYDLLVIGAGASGVAAAIAARESGFAGTIAILEKEKHILRKLLASGNGRCNLVNTRPVDGHYHGANPTFALEVIGKKTASSLLSWFQQLGLLTMEDREGRVYPRSFQANSVALVLEATLHDFEIDIQLSSAVRTIHQEKGGFYVATDDNDFITSTVIIASGSAASPELGGSSLGYALLSSLGHAVNTPRPSLVPLNLSPHPLMTYASGVRFRGEALFRGYKGESACSKGEFLITSYGLSGIAAMELGRSVGRIASSPAGTIYLDFLPEKSEEEIMTMLQVMKRGDRDVNVLLSGFVPEKIGKSILKTLNKDIRTAKKETIVQKLSEQLKSFALEVRDTRGFRFAQVASGGVRTDEFNASTLMSKQVKGLFSCGEVLDIDGDTGGYNLLWAFSSGYTAGQGAAAYLSGQK